MYAALALPWRLAERVAEAAAVTARCSAGKAIGLRASVRVAEGHPGAASWQLEVHREVARGAVEADARRGGYVHLQP